MNLYYLLIAVLVVFIAWLAYDYANQPQPLDDRANSAMDQLEQGNLGNAINEITPQTRGENLLNETKEMIGVTPTSTF